MKCQWILGGEDPLEKAWQPTPVFLPGEFYGQKSLAGYSPRDGKELTEWLSTLTCIHKRGDGGDDPDPAGACKELDNTRPGICRKLSEQGA